MGISAGSSSKPSSPVHHRTPREPSAVKYQPNLTPLIDVLFLLLLFFLLGTQMRHEEGQIPLTLPASTPREPGGPPVLLVDVRPVGQWNQSAMYEVGNGLAQMVDPRQLGLRLAELKARGTDVHVLIRARQDVRWEFVLEALNQAKAAKCTDIAFAPAGS